MGASHSGGPAVVPDLDVSRRMPPAIARGPEIADRVARLMNRQAPSHDAPRPADDAWFGIYKGRESEDKKERRSHLTFGLYPPPLCAAKSLLWVPELRDLSWPERARVLEEAGGPREERAPRAGYEAFLASIRGALVMERVGIPHLWDDEPRGIGWALSALPVESSMVMELLRGVPADNVDSPLHPWCLRGSALEPVVARLAERAAAASDTSLSIGWRREHLIQWEELVLGHPLISSLVAWAYLRNVRRERRSADWWESPREWMAKKYVEDVELTLVPWPMFGSYPAGSKFAFMDADPRQRLAVPPMQMLSKRFMTCQPPPRGYVPPEQPDARRIAEIMLVAFTTRLRPLPLRGIDWPALQARVHAVVAQHRMVAHHLAEYVHKDRDQTFFSRAQLALEPPGGVKGQQIAALEDCVRRVREATEADDPDAVEEALLDWEETTTSDINLSAMVAFCYVRGMLAEGYRMHDKPPHCDTHAFMESDVQAMNIPWPRLNDRCHGFSTAFIFRRDGTMLCAGPPPSCIAPHLRETAVAYTQSPARSKAALEAAARGEVFTRRTFPWRKRVTPEEQRAILQQREEERRARRAYERRLLRSQAPPPPPPPVPDAKAIRKQKRLEAKRREAERLREEKEREAKVLEAFRQAAERSKLLVNQVRLDPETMVTALAHTDNPRHGRPSPHGYAPLDGDTPELYDSPSFRIDPNDPYYRLKVRRQEDYRFRQELLAAAARPDAADRTQSAAAARPDAADRTQSAAAARPDAAERTQSAAAARSAAYARVAAAAAAGRGGPYQQQPRSAMSGLRAPFAFGSFRESCPCPFGASSFGTGASEARPTSFAFGTAARSSPFGASEASRVPQARAAASPATRAGSGGTRRQQATAAVEAAVAAAAAAAAPVYYGPPRPPQHAAAAAAPVYYGPPRPPQQAAPRAAARAPFTVVSGSRTYCFPSYVPEE
jgi:hypothetical protein